VPPCPFSVSLAPPPVSLPLLFGLFDQRFLVVSVISLHVVTLGLAWSLSVLFFWRFLLMPGDVSRHYPAPLFKSMVRFGFCSHSWAPTLLCPSHTAPLRLDYPPQSPSAGAGPPMALFPNFVGRAPVFCCFHVTSLGSAMVSSFSVISSQ